MHQFLVDTDYAVRGLFDLLGNEQERLTLEVLRHDLALGEKGRAVALLHQTIDNPRLRKAQPFYEHEVAEIRRKLAGHTESIERLTEQIAAKAVAMSAIAGAILQIAKQAIAIAQPTGQGDARRGRPIGGQSVRSVIWQARNQAMHWDEGHLHAPVVECFTQLVRDFGPRFDLSQQRSLAKEVIEVALEWRSYEHYKIDLEMLTS